MHSIEPGISRFRACRCAVPRNADCETAAPCNGIPYTLTHGMDRRRYRVGGAAAWRILRHRRTPDAWPWPPPWPGARRRRLADAAAAAAGEKRHGGGGGGGGRRQRALLHP